jgi:hypothetical protein
MHQEVRSPIIPRLDTERQAQNRSAFTPWRRTREGTASRRLAEEVAKLITDREQRGRQRKAKDAATFSAVVDAVVANLLFIQLSTDATPEQEIRGRLLVPLSGRQLKSASQSRYDRTPMPLGILRARNEKGRGSRPGVLDVMADLELIYLDIAPSHPEAARASTIKCAERMLELIAEHGPSLSDLETRWRDVTYEGETVERELLVLRDAKVEQRFHLLRSPERRERAPEIDYGDDDDERIGPWREQLRRINLALDAADITFDAGNGVINGCRVPSVGIAVHERTLHRVFNNGLWTNGGRLFGGFWQGLQRELRSGIRIEGRAVASLDFSSMFLQLLYAMKAKAPTPDGDLYEGIDPIKGWPADPEQRDAIRDVIKANVNAMFFRKQSRIGKPHILLPNSAQVLSKGTTGAVLEQRLKAKHSAIAKWIGAQGIGYELFFHESEIMIKTVISCLDQDVVVLPIHDGLLVAVPHSDIARAAMCDAFREHTGGFIARISG